MPVRLTLPVAFLVALQVAAVAEELPSELLLQCEGKAKSMILGSKPDFSDSRCRPASRDPIF
jgi:hypothetical protein